MPPNEGTNQNQQAPGTPDPNPDPNAANFPPAQDPGGSGGTPDKTDPLVYDDWIKEQPDEVKTLLEGNVSGLKSALKSERDLRADLERDLKDLTNTLEGEPKAKAEELLGEYAKATEKVGFYDDALQAGVVNPALAYHIVVSEKRIDRRGRVNFTELEADYPDLFTKKARRPNVPSGAGEGGNAGTPQNEGDPLGNAIRKAAGFR